MMSPTTSSITATRRVDPATTNTTYMLHSTSTRASYSSTSQIMINPLDQFRDPVDRQTRATEKVGRSWSAKELRRKSYEDLHKLWYVLYKERNMLLTEQQLSRRRQLVFPQPNRLYKVQKSMGAIRQVLGERKRVKVEEHLASQMEKSMNAESDTLLLTEDELDVLPAGAGGEK
jgi:large subunit ribosomal protein L47